MILREDDSDVAVLTLSHGKVHALDLELLQALEERLGEVECSPARAVVLTGSGGIFSAGVNLVRLLEGGAAYLRDFLPVLTTAMSRLFFFPKPVVAAVSGHAIAGGCVLAAACDHRIMARGPGRIGVTELLVGVPFPAIALEIMRFALPPHQAQEALYTGRTWGVDEALRRGFVDEVVEAPLLLERARAVAGALGALPPATFRLTKEQLRQPARERWEASRARIDAEVGPIWTGPEARAAIETYVRQTLGKSARAR
jgi:enoyl-CoA hydratase